MDFKFSTQCELPFVLNLPDGPYRVALNQNNAYTITISNQLFSLNFTSNNKKYTAFGSIEQISTQLNIPEDEVAHAATKLRTVTNYSWGEKLDIVNLPQLTISLNECMQSELLRHDRKDLIGDNLQISTQREIDILTTEQLLDFETFQRQKLYARQSIPQASDRFLSALNRLIRWYMALINDPFVEEVGFHQLGATSTLGIQFAATVDGKMLESAPFVGKAPSILKSPWRPITDEIAATIQKHLDSASEPDFAAVLLRRAEHSIEITAFRNAIAEAATALEIAVARAIRRGMIKQGKSENDITSELGKTKSRFPQRAEDALRHWCGKGVLELDPVLWAQIRADRASHRNAIVHSDLEPLESETREITARFRKMAEMIFHL
ncbi:hypothetical protein HMI49_10560 [Corallococcus exercitus]|uniref:Uncharacterized protein n=1 Tax=Corallococcus exercitus TaxID=2316736 RepID=A0A7Y4KGZ5_9BACT|nr:hypothetical protein [Corallococcus exercitus]NOK33640.1 hypothetical protein [Corallococcus exercitus]